MLYYTIEIFWSVAHNDRFTKQKKAEIVRYSSKKKNFSLDFVKKKKVANFTIISSILNNHEKSLLKLIT